MCECKGESLTRYLLSKTTCDKSKVGVKEPLDITCVLGPFDEPVTIYALIECPSGIVSVTPKGIKKGIVAAAKNIVLTDIISCSLINIARMPDGLQGEYTAKLFVVRNAEILAKTEVGFVIE